MKKLIFIVGIVFSIQAFSQAKLGIIKYDTLEENILLKGVTQKGELYNIPIIYTAKFHADSISGAPEFKCGIIVSTGGIVWDTIDSWDVVMSGRVWDTIIFETTSFLAPKLGVFVRSKSADQESRHRVDLIISYPNFYGLDIKDFIYLK
jgi:hypothetical protein